MGKKRLFLFRRIEAGHSYLYSVFNSYTKKERPAVYVNEKFKKINKPDKFNSGMGKPVNDGKVTWNALFQEQANPERVMSYA